MKKKFTFKSICSLVLVAIFLISIQNLSAQIDLSKYKNGDKSFSDLLKFTADGNGYSDQSIIIFIPDATEDFDSDYDAYKLSGIPAAPQLYSIIPCCNLAVNALPYIGTSRVVNMGFEVGVSTTYTISATFLYTFGPDVTIHMEDTRDNVMVDLMADSIYTFTADPGDAAQRFNIIFNHTLNLDLKVYLEGPFNGTDMDTDLNDAGLIPLNQPYNVAPWNYMGIESVTSIPTNVVDWILVELRDTTQADRATEEAIIARQACFLLNDGSVVGLDGSNMPEFKTTYDWNIFFVVYHRNHLGVSASYVANQLGFNLQYNFTFSPGQALYQGHKQLTSSKWGMYGGDGDANGTVDSNDKVTEWSTVAGEAGYSGSDYNLDGEINNPDKDDIWVENENVSSEVL